MCLRLSDSSDYIVVMCICKVSNGRVTMIQVVCLCLLANYYQLFPLPGAILNIDLFGNKEKLVYLQATLAFRRIRADPLSFENCKYIVSHCV